MPYENGDYVVTNSSQTFGKLNGKYAQIRNKIYSTPSGTAYFDLDIFYSDENGKRKITQMNAISNVLVRPLTAVEESLLLNGIYLPADDSDEDDLYRKAIAAMEEINDTKCFTPLKWTPPFDWLIPKRIVYNDPATVVFWTDGTKTVVKRSKKDEPNPYFGFCAALAKKIFGTNSRVNRFVAEGYDQKAAQEKKKEQKEKTVKGKTKNAGNSKSKKCK